MLLRVGGRGPPRIILPEESPFAPARMIPPEENAPGNDLETKRPRPPPTPPPPHVLLEAIVAWKPPAIEACNPPTPPPAIEAWRSRIKKLLDVRPDWHKTLRDSASAAESTAGSAAAIAADESAPDSDSVVSHRDDDWSAPYDEEEPENPEDDDPEEIYSACQRMTRRRLLEVTDGRPCWEERGSWHFRRNRAWHYGRFAAANAVWRHHGGVASYL